jgi:hypothetical protein
MSASGTELPIPNVRSSVANGSEADKICSMRVLRILTHPGHKLHRNPAAQQSPAVLRCAIQRCLEAAFRFLLDREPKESILRRFNVTAISRYFPEFEREMPRYLSQL